MSVLIRPLQEADKAGWRALYDQYAVFYKVPMPDEKADLVWSWLTDDAHECKALVAQAPNDDDAKRLLGLAHYRRFARPLAGGYGGFLDDLFVAPSARGANIGKMLVQAVAEEGRRHGWNVIRWITAEDNYRARGLYDQVAEKTNWTTYDLKLD